jgi:hypothetical protein
MAEPVKLKPNPGIQAKEKSMKGMIGNIGGCPWLAITILALSAVAWPAAARAAECQFAIRATNDRDSEVWIDLYDSKVYRKAILTGVEQLKIQNHRLQPGKSMDRRYTAKGKCGADRTWLIRHRITVNGKLEWGYFRLETGGTSSTSRTVDLGRASKFQIHN